MWNNVFRWVSETIGESKRFRVRLEPYGALVFDKHSGVIIELNEDEVKQLLGKNIALPQERIAPIYAHIELTNQCNLNCPECYVERKQEHLSFQQLKSIIHKLAMAGVFSVTFGGGEPMLRKDVFKLAKYARWLGLGVSMTTNGTLLKPASKLSLFHQINFSIHRNLPEIEPTIVAAKKYTKVGISLIAEDEHEIRNIANFCRLNDIELLLLAYKPVGRIKQAIPANEVPFIAMKLAQEGVKVAVDGLAIGTCRAANDFVDISCEGDVYPCSFIRKSIGNMLKQDFSDIWQNRPKTVECPFKQNPF
jgi:MoaA/NifB/PqqE/SkfB family radical SAM enzyme